MKKDVLKIPKDSNLPVIAAVLAGVMILTKFLSVEWFDGHFVSEFSTPLQHLINEFNFAQENNINYPAAAYIYNIFHFILSNTFPFLFLIFILLFSKKKFILLSIPLAIPIILAVSNHISLIISIHINSHLIIGEITLWTYLYSFLNFSTVILLYKILVFIHILRIGLGKSKDKTILIIESLIMVILIITRQVIPFFYSNPTLYISSIVASISFVFAILFLCLDLTPATQAKEIA